MKNLGAKLALLKKTSAAANKAPEVQAKPRQDYQTDVRLKSVLEGELEPTESGDIFVVRRHYPLSQRYGRTRLEGSLGMPVTLLKDLYQDLDGFQMSRSLFFDTETTGLAGGSGTYAFLVGIGYFEKGELVTEQLLMRDHGDEPALLSHLSKRLEGKNSLVSFNGRSFDAQLLSTRYQMHRRQAPFADLAHLDLLHLCRRLWRWSRLPDCRLETLETRVLGAPRHQDVPGWMIPDMFFDFLRDRNPVPLKGVIEHNRRDLIAMVALCSHLGSLLNHEVEPDEPHLCLGLARLWAVLEQCEKSDHLFKQALTDRRLGEEAREKGLIHWARDLKRRKMGEKAALLWRKTLTHYPGNLEATVELAKWLEHGQRDFYSALQLVEGGLCDRRLTSVRRRELEHRASRLRRRLAVEASTGQ